MRVIKYRAAGSMTDDVRNELTGHILPFWEGLQDEEYGGYYGYMDYDLHLDRKAVKGCILNSRITWCFANAAMVLNDPGLEAYAYRGYEFLKAHCLDPECGGVYWSVSYDGRPEDTTKHTYNQAFAIYALSSYYDMSKDAQALSLAMKLFYLIETRMRDADGYLEAFDRDFQPVSNDKLSENGVIAQRTMNTILHVIEAYTELLRVSGDDEVRRALEGALRILAGKIYNPTTKHLNVFMDREYHSLLHLWSYGHDIEAAWLVDRAVEVLEQWYKSKESDPGGSVRALTAADTGSFSKQKEKKSVQASGQTTVSAKRIPEQKSERVRPDNPVGVANYTSFQTLSSDLHQITAVLTDQVYRYGFDGHSIPAEIQDGIVKQDRVWWVQCEGINGFLEGYQRERKEEYLTAAGALWDYIKTYVIDKRPGSEWYWYVNPDGTPAKEPIVEPWKCPYHNGRMCLEVIRRSIDAGGHN